MGKNMIVSKLINKAFYYYGQVKYRLIMRQFGAGSRIVNPMLIVNPNNIVVGCNVLIRNGVRLEVVGEKNDIVIEIGDNVNIEQNVHIVAKDSIKIGNNVSITGCCSIVDIIHPYDEHNDIEKIGNRISDKISPVTIGDNSFIGFGSHINPGVNIGKNCIIGARSVVTKNIPDNCVAAGVPARVIKKLNISNDEWEII